MQRNNVQFSPETYTVGIKVTELVNSCTGISYMATVLNLIYSQFCCIQLLELILQNVNKKAVHMNIIMWSTSLQAE